MIIRADTLSVATAIVLRYAQRSYNSQTAISAYKLEQQPKTSINHYVRDNPAQLLRLRKCGCLRVTQRTCTHAVLFCAVPTCMHAVLCCAVLC
jgi:predicted house-cleaning NTP pyrophosphatase (Maf/HAM1 superfamily)